MKTKSIFLVGITVLLLLISSYVTTAFIPQNSVWCSTEKTSLQQSQKLGTLHGRILDFQNPSYGYADALVRVYFDDTYQEATSTSPDGEYAIDQIPLDYRLKKVTVTLYSVFSETVYQIIDKNITYDFYVKPTSHQTIYVGGDGPGNYTRIQDAVNDAGTADTVFVYNGTYSEYVSIYKRIRLVGENQDTTVIDAGGSGDVLYVSADGTLISEFTLRNSGQAEPPIRDCGIDLRSDHHCLSDICFEDNDFGISLHNTQYTRIRDCRFVGNRWGVSAATSQERNEIQHNQFLENKQGGLQLDTFQNCQILGNQIEENTGVGLQLNTAQNNTVINNVFDHNNGTGICLSSDSHKNILFHNALINNTLNAYDEGNNTWNDTYPSGGNFWSDYTGEDLFSGPAQNQTPSDGIGDVPYNLSGENATDYYPYMIAEGWINRPPWTPSDPVPEDGAVDVPIDSVLRWNASDPDEADTLTFDVFFGTDENPVQVAANITDVFYDPPGNLLFNTTYYWQIRVWDASNASTTGPVWSFTTEELGDTTLAIRFVNISLGTLCFTIENTGSYDAVDITWELTMQSIQDFPSIPGRNQWNGTIPLLKAGTAQTVCSDDRIVGLGFFTTTGQAEALNAPVVSVEKKMILIAFLLFLFS